MLNYTRNDTSKINTPQDFLRLASAGLCGNTPRIFLQVEASFGPLFNNEIPAVYIGSVNEGGSFNNFRLYRQTWAQVDDLRYKAACNNGMLPHMHRPGEFIRWSDLYAMESPDDEKQTGYPAFQGHWWPEERYLLWNISDQPLGRCHRSGLIPCQFVMSPRLIEEMFGSMMCVDPKARRFWLSQTGAMAEARGIMAIEILKRHLGPESYEELREVEAQYPSAIIEFTRFGWPWGIYGRHLGIWEIRNY